VREGSEGVVGEWTAGRADKWEEGRLLRVAFRVNIGEFSAFIAVEAENILSLEFRVATGNFRTLIHDVDVYKDSHAYTQI
jgi:hypothetical protein